MSFFLGSWDMNRSAEQTNRVNREAVLVRFVCSALRFISHEPRKKDTHSLYLQCLQQRPLLKFSEQSKKFKFPAEIGHLTLFPDKTIIAYSFRQNSAWINGENVVCCECFHTLKQYQFDSKIKLTWISFIKMKFCNIRYRVPHAPICNAEDENYKNRTLTLALFQELG